MSDNKNNGGLSAETSPFRGMHLLSGLNPVWSFIAAGFFVATVGGALYVSGEDEKREAAYQEINAIFNAAGITDPKAKDYTVLHSRDKDKKACALLVPPMNGACEEIHDRFFNRDPAP